MSQLNATAACVLGILQLGPAPGQKPRVKGGMTGWQVAEAAKVSVARFWNITRSQIYRELLRLEADELIVATAKEGQRSSVPYRATDAGKRAFKAWLQELVDDEAKDEQLKSPLVLTVFFGELVPATSLTRSLQEHRLRHERNLVRLRAIESAMDASTKKRMPASTVARGIAYQQLSIRFIDDALALLG